MNVPRVPRGEKKLGDFLGELHAKHGKDVGGLGADQPDPERIPSSVAAFDIATGGGWPIGRLSMIHSKESRGKTTLMLVTIADYLRRNPKMKAAFVDAEKKLSTTWARKLGIDQKRFIPLWPDWAEQSVDWVEGLLLRQPDVGLIVYDSVAALQTRAEVEKTADEDTYGGAGKAMSKMAKKATTAICLAKREGRSPTVIFVNQPRKDISSRHGGTYLPGGRLMMHQMLMIVNLYKRVEIKEDDASAVSALEIHGVIEKAQLPTISSQFKFTMATRQHKSLNPGQCDDWGFVSGYMEDFGLYGKLEKPTKSEVYGIMDQRFRIQKECRDWYMGHKDACVRAIIEHLAADPEMA